MFSYLGIINDLSLRVSQVVPNIYLPCAHDDVRILGVTFHVVVGGASLRTRQLSPNTLSTESTWEPPVPGCVVTYCGSNLSLNFSASGSR